MKPKGIFNLQNQNFTPVKIALNIFNQSFGIVRFMLFCKIHSNNSSYTEFNMGN